jgi:hypothetical protein
LAPTPSSTAYALHSLCRCCLLPLLPPAPPAASSCLLLPAGCAYCPRSALAFDLLTCCALPCRCAPIQFKGEQGLYSAERCAKLVTSSKLLADLPMRGSFDGL